MHAHLSPTLILSVFQFFSQTPTHCLCLFSFSFFISNLPCPYVLSGTLSVQFFALSLLHSIFLSICLSKFSLIFSLQQSRSLTLSVLLTYCRSICLIFAGLLSHTLSLSVLSVCLSVLLAANLSVKCLRVPNLSRGILAPFVSLPLPQSNSHLSSMSDSLFLSLCPSFSPVIGPALFFTHTLSRWSFALSVSHSGLPFDLSVKLSLIFSSTLSFFHLVCRSHFR